MQTPHPLENCVIKSASSEQASSADILKRILADETNIAIWQRPQNPAPQAIHELIHSSFNALQCVFHKNQKLDAIAAYFDEHLQLTAPDAFFLVQDIMNLAELFLSLDHSQTIGIRLEKITHDNCKAFHVDYLSLRMLCTYHGKATEWIDNSSVDRTGLGKNNNDLVVRDSHQIQSFQTNWVGILKGENFKNNQKRGIVHRSPQITGTTASPRILLRIDSLERFGSNL